MMPVTGAEPDRAPGTWARTQEVSRMGDTLTRIAENLIGRVTGPMKLRLVLQPLMASVFALLAGLKDAKAGKPPYFWGLFHDPEHRKEMLQSGWKSVGKVFVLAMVLDIVYQLVELRMVYPFEVILVAFLLAIVPYVLVRGVVTRLASKQ
jgi:hypothetical protein